MTTMDTTNQDPVSGEEDELPEVEELQDTSKNNYNSKRKPFKYRDQDDIRLLQEVLLEKPAGKNAHLKWKEIYKRHMLPVPNYRSIQTRFEKLMEAFKKNTLKSMRGSGTEEDYDEKCRLLTDIAEGQSDWVEEAAKETESQRKKNEEDSKKASVIRNAAVQSLSDADSPMSSTEPRPKMRKKSSDYVAILKNSEESKIDFESRRLTIEEREATRREENDKHRREMELRQLEMEEKKMEIEKQKIEKELEERRMWMKLFENINKKS